MNGETAAKAARRNRHQRLVENSYVDVPLGNRRGSRSMQQTPMTDRMMPDLDAKKSEIMSRIMDGEITPEQGKALIDKLERSG